jgi:adenylate cyclase
MVDEIITKLSKNRMLTVISRNSTFFYKGKSINIRKVGEELGAKYVEGSVCRSRDTIRITAQLREATTDRHLWARTYDRELHDVFSVQLIFDSVKFDRV